MYCRIDNLTYLTIILVCDSAICVLHSWTMTCQGCLRAGITVFPVSPRFSPGVISHLLRTANATHILVSENMYDVANQAVEDIKTTPSPQRPHLLPGIVHIPTYQDLYPSDESKTSGVVLLPPHRPEFGKAQPPMILHSSSKF